MTAPRHSAAASRKLARDIAWVAFRNREYRLTLAILIWPETIHGRERGDQVRFAKRDDFDADVTPDELPRCQINIEQCFVLGKARALNVIDVWTSEALSGRLHPSAEMVTEALDANT